MICSFGMEFQVRLYYESSCIHVDVRWYSTWRKQIVGIVTILPTTLLRYVFNVGYMQFWYSNLVKWLKIGHLLLKTLQLNLHYLYLIEGSVISRLDCLIPAPTWKTLPENILLSLSINPKPYNFLKGGDWHSSRTCGVINDRIPIIKVLQILGCWMSIMRMYYIFFKNIHELYELSHEYVHHFIASLKIPLYLRWLYGFSN